MLCATAGAGLNEAGYYYELKLDGVRVLAEVSGGEVRLVYRSGREVTHIYPEICEAVAALGHQNLVLDGEIVAFDDGGRPDFQKLAQRFHGHRDVGVARATIPVMYLVFDVLKVGDTDARSSPLSQRKELLAAIVPADGPLVRRLEYFEDDGRPLYEFCRQHRLEGVVAKRKSSRYRPGRSPDGEWVKIRLETEDDFVVFAWNHGSGDRERLGALEVGSYEGDTLVARGRVGSGFDEALIDLLLERLDALAVKRTAVHDTKRPEKPRNYVRPEIVVRVRYSRWSNGGRLVFPVFAGIRDDVEPGECTAGPKVL
jgi:bifunctional non-homologous end joining protein LigD